MSIFCNFKSNFHLYRFFAKTVSGVLQSIKTALPLPIPGFDNDQSPPVQLLPLPLPSFLPTFEPPEREEKSSQSTASSMDEMDSRSIPVSCRVTYASEESKLEQLLNNWNHIDCRIESAYEAFESHLWRSELNIQLSQETTAPDSKPRRESAKRTAENIHECIKGILIFIMYIDFIFILDYISQRVGIDLMNNYHYRAAS